MKQKDHTTTTCLP